MIPVPYILRRVWAIFLILQSQIICIRSDCGPPPAIEHTQPLTVLSGVPGDTVNYECDRSTRYYEIPNIGRTITCQDDNTWSTVTEFCARGCGVPERFNFAVPRNNDLQKDIFLPGTNVTYNCRDGFRRSAGSINRITCLDNFTWSTPSQFCEPKSCNHPQDTENGEFNATNEFFFGSRVEYTCNDGYRLASKRNYRDCQADGTWSNAVPLCEAILCKAPQTPADVIYNPPKDEYAYHDAVTFACLGGLHISGNSTASCTSDGTWSSSPPNCIAVNCKDPGQIQNGERTSGFVGPYTLDSAVGYKCFPKFVMKGSPSVTCKANNQWEPEIPKCLTTCQIPEIANSELKHPNKMHVHGDVLEHECKQGYMLSGSSTITCSSQGHWEPSLPECKESISGLSKGAITAIAVIAVVVLIVAAVLSWYFLKKKTGEYYCEHKNDLFKQTVEQELTESNNANRNPKTITPDVQYSACTNA